MLSWLIIIDNEPWNRVEEYNRLENDKYVNWIYQDLVEELEREKLNNASLQKLITLLENKDKELKTVAPQTSWIRSVMPFGKERRLNQSRMVLNSAVANNNNNNSLPITPIIISIVGLIALFGLVVYKKRHQFY